jgi:hypothetical protein
MEEEPICGKNLPPTFNPPLVTLWVTPLRYDRLTIVRSIGSAGTRL